MRIRAISSFSLFFAAAGALRRCCFQTVSFVPSHRSLSSFSPHSVVSIFRISISARLPREKVKRASSIFFFFFLLLLLEHSSRRRRRRRLYEDSSPVHADGCVFPIIVSANVSRENNHHHQNREEEKEEKEKVKRERKERPHSLFSSFTSSSSRFFLFFSSSRCHFGRFFSLLSRRNVLSNRYYNLGFLIFGKGKACVSVSLAILAHIIIERLFFVLK